MNYKLWIEGEAKGPLTLEDLRVMWEEGDIDGQTLYAEEGSEDYKPLSGLAAVLNIAAPEAFLHFSRDPVPAGDSVPAQNAVVNPEEKIYIHPIPVLTIYTFGAFALGIGVVLLLNKDTNINVFDADAYLSLVKIGVFALLVGYLCDLIAKCLFELKEANRLRRGK